MKNTKADYIKHLEKSFDNAEKGKSKLTELLLGLNGFTGKKPGIFTTIY